MDRSSMHNISKDRVDLNNTINQGDIMKIYKLVHKTATEYTLFSSSKETFTKIDHILHHKINLKKKKRNYKMSVLRQEMN